MHFNHSLAALRFAHLANGVSQLHGRVSRAMWSKYEIFARSFPLPMRKTSGTGPISNLYRFKEAGDDYGIDDRKKYLKKRAFEIVADQTGKLFQPSDVLQLSGHDDLPGIKEPGLLQLMKIGLKNY